jgi:predicted secreted acid phosphatase
MSRFGSLWRGPRGFAVGLSMGLVLAVAGVAAATLTPPTITTPVTDADVANIDVSRLEIKNYYGDSSATTGAGATAGWTHALNLDSNYAKQTTKIAERAMNYLARHKNDGPGQAIVLDVDDTTLATWNYELYSNWDYNPTTNAQFVGLTGSTFTGNAFPAVPGMFNLIGAATAEHYAVFFITGRPDSQHKVTLANLFSDQFGGFPNTDVAKITNSAGGTTTIPDQDAGFASITPVDIGHGGPSNGGSNFYDGLFTKPAVGNYPAYLNKPEFCGPSITAGTSCPTIQYKSGTRAYIESLGFKIVANFGDQFSDLLGGYAMKTFKMPNPNYYLP